MSTRTRRRVLLGVAAIAVAALLLGAAVLRRSSGASSWRELGSLSELTERFNRDEGSYRLVLLLSPT